MLNARQVYMQMLWNDPGYNTGENDLELLDSIIIFILNWNIRNIIQVQLRHACPIFLFEYSVFKSLNESPRK